MIHITDISLEETLRYLGNSNVKVNREFLELFNNCKNDLLNALNIKYLYKTVSVKDSPFKSGNDIKKVLKPCEKAVVLCATVGVEVDNLIRKYQIENMAKAVTLDAMASVAIEDVVDKVQSLIAKENKDGTLLPRFSPGYGDYPLALQETYLKCLDAQRKIGLCVTDSFLLTPTKSVTAIIGITEKPVKKGVCSCETCNLSETCKYRKAGKSCDN